LILLGGLGLFLVGYLVYTYFLGGIDGLPILSAEYLPDDTKAIVEGRTFTFSETKTKFKWAFGNECEEAEWPIKLDSNAKGLLLAAKQFEFENGRVKLSPFSAAFFRKSRGDGAFPEINIVQCPIAYLTLDQPVTNPTELNNRKITEIELLGGKTGIHMSNNRRTAEKSDDIELFIYNAPMYYNQQKNLIWTDGYVRLWDNKTQPHPTQILAKGMELKLTEDSGPNRTQSAPKSRAKDDAVSDVELLTLKSNVEMHLYLDASSPFLAGPADPKTKIAVQAAPAEKAHVLIRTTGRFQYDPTKELAQFDSPAPGDGTADASDQVLVSREHKVGDTKTFDELKCDHLELQFRKKKDVDPRAPRDPEAADKEIDTALATARFKELTLQLESENIDASGVELHYRSPSAGTGPQTILKGPAGAPMHAVKDGHKIEARELHLIGADQNGNGQQAFAKGPGRIDLYDKSNPGNQFAKHAVWNDSLISVRERDGDKTLDILTLTGDAAFVDEEHQQSLYGQRVHVTLESDLAPSALAPGRLPSANSSSKQKPRRIEAFEKVALRSPEFIIHLTNHLDVIFKNEPVAGSKLPAQVTLLQPLAPPGSEPPPVQPSTGPTSRGEGPPSPTERKTLIQTPTKSRKPLELWANDVVAYMSNSGDKQELQELKTNGAVHVFQDGEEAPDKKTKAKGVDITGDMLNLVHHPGGDTSTLFVFGRDPRSPAQLQLGELYIIGPKVTINQKENIAEVDGAGAMNMPSNTSFEGGKAVKGNTRLTIHWNKDMIFNGKYADFHGGVQAFQDNATLKCQDLFVTLDRVVSFKEGQKENQDAKVEKLVCDHKVWVVDDKRDADGRQVQFDRLVATELTMDNQDGPIIAAGVGKVEHLAKGAPGGLQGPAPHPKADAPKEADVMKLTRVLFERRMYSNNKDNLRTAKFYENVEVVHFPTEDPDAKMNVDNPPKDGFYMRCNVLSVFTRQLDNKTSQMMEASGNVFFRAQEFFGKAAVVKYNESLDQIIFEGTEGNPATVYKKLPGMQQPQEIRAVQILYNRKTGKFEIGRSSLIQG
jgi:hypothetical protein